MTDTPPTDGAQLDDDWRTAYPARLAELARAWQDPAAWEGMTRAGGVDFPGEVGGSVALAEVVIHGWDVARATGQLLRRRPGHDQALLEYLAQFDPAGTARHVRPGRAGRRRRAGVGPGHRAERPGSGLGGRRLTGAHWSHGSGRRPAPDCLLQGPGA